MESARTGSAIVTEDFESRVSRPFKTDRVVSLLYKDNVKQIPGRYGAAGFGGYRNPQSESGGKFMTCMVEVDPHE